jgi:GNAT superfamily N-acetyltransferase
VEIEYLADHLDFVPALAKWHYDQWKDFVDGDSIDRRVQLLLTRARHRAVPTIFVAFDGAQLLGSATLAEHDMDTRLDLTPWMVDVFVAPEFRHRGIASALVRRIVHEAAELGVAELYLFTTGHERERLYAGLGWSVRERPIYRGVERVLMSIAPRS